MGLLATVGHPHRCGECGSTWTHKTWSCQWDAEATCPACVEKAAGEAE